MEKIRKAVIYARVSSEEQGDKYSLPAQLDLLRTYAINNSIEVVKEYVEAETAKQAGRHKFNEMLSFLKKHKDVKIILCEKTDRLYRNFNDYVEVGETDYDLYFVKEGTIINRNSSSHEKLVHGLKVLLAKNFIDNLREETQKGRKKKAEQGYFIGQVPYGYKKLGDKKTTIIDKEKAPFVRRAFELYASGMSLEKVRDTLAEEKYVYQPAHPKISKGQLGKMLQNVCYIGGLKHAGIIYEGKHPHIVSQELFDKAQLSFRKDNKPLKRNERSHAFLGLIKCGKCGCAVTIEPPKRHGYIYYHCTGSKGTCEQKRKNVREEKIMAQLDNAVKAVSLASEHIEYIKQGLKESLKDKKEYSEEMKTRLNAEIKKIESRLEQLYLDKLDGIITLEDWAEKNQKWKHDLNDKRIQLEALQNTEQKYYEEGVRIIETLKNAYELYIQQPVSEKRKMLDYLISNVTLEGEKVSYNYNLPFSYFVNFSKSNKKYPRCDSNAWPTA